MDLMTRSAGTALHLPFEMLVLGSNKAGHRTSTTNTTCDTQALGAVSTARIGKQIEQTHRFTSVATARRWPILPSKRITLQMTEPTDCD